MLADSSAARWQRRSDSARLQHEGRLLLALLAGRHVHHPPTATGGLGVLTAHLQTPVVAQTAVVAASLQALDVLTELLVQDVRVRVHRLTYIFFCRSCVASFPIFPHHEMGDHH